jgi:hypothetical protein
MKLLGGRGGIKVTYAEEDCPNGRYGGNIIVHKHALLQGQHAFLGPTVLGEEVAAQQAYLC